MRAIVLDGEISFRSDYPDPAPAPGESIVRVRRAGICGTDLELARGYMSYRGGPGHEFVGEVIDGGDPAMRGRRVVGEINAGCGKCAMCARSMSRHCPNRTVLGILGRDGAFAEYLRLPDENLLALPDSLPDEVAVFTEPVAAAYEIFEQVQIPRTSRILVLGDGRLGAIVAIAFRAEQYDVLVGGHHRAKMEVLENLGIATAVESELEPGFDVVVDCTGASAGFARAIQLVKARGTLILKSTAAASAALNLAPVVINEITVVGSRCGRFAPALSALESGRIDPRPLISASFPLDDGIRAIHEASRFSSLKVILRVS